MTASIRFGTIDPDGREAAVEPLARAAGLDHRVSMSAGGRWFARLERPR